MLFFGPFRQSKARRPQIVHRLRPLFGLLITLSDFEHLAKGRDRLLQHRIAGPIPTQRHLRNAIMAHDFGPAVWHRAPVIDRQCFFKSRRRRFQMRCGFFRHHRGQLIQRYRTADLGPCPIKTIRIAA